MMRAGHSPFTSELGKILAAIPNLGRKDLGLLYDAAVIEIVGWKKPEKCDPATFEKMIHERKYRTSKAVKRFLGAMPNFTEGGLKCIVFAVKNELKKRNRRTYKGKK